VVWGTVVILVALFVVAAWPGGIRAQPSFYATAAQVIPVLILALAVERVWRAWSFWERLILALVLVGGEAAAMFATAYDVQPKGHTYYEVASSRVFTDMLVWAAVASIGVGLIGVLWSTIFEPGADRR
jgi:hypothetical protein